MSEPNLAAKMRARLNARAGKVLTLETTRTEDLLQVESWIPMPKHFQRATGAPGIPVGHVTQVIGESDTGKTTEVMLAMVATQLMGGIVYLVDAEHKFSFERYRNMGGTPEDLIIMPADSLEEVWNHFKIINEDIADLRKVKKTSKGEITDPGDQKTPVLAVWDSVAASVPDAIQEGDAEDSHVSVEAKINNKEIRKIRKQLRDNKIAAFFINHSYRTMPKFGPPVEVIKGGAEMFYMSTLILKTKRREWLKRTIDGIEERFGTKSFLEVFKGHLGGSKASAPFWIVGQGVLETPEELEDYKDLIDGIEGPDINKLSLDQLREIRANRPKKDKKEEKVEKGGKKGKDKKGAKKKQQEAEGASEPEELGEQGDT